MKYSLTLLLWGFFCLPLNAQLNRYRVQFADKTATSFQLNNPAAFLSQRAIDRRARYHIPVDSADLPIPSVYIEQLQAVPGVVLLNQSKWLNAASILITESSALLSIQALPFVTSIEGIAARRGNVPNLEEDEIIPLSPVSSRRQKTGSDYFNYGPNSLAEITLHNGQFLHNLGLRGNGMQIAMLDGGFYNYLSLPAFDSVNSHNRVLTTWDFVSRHASVSEDHPHGMQCFSIIAANIPGQFVGKAPEASFHLFRTEDAASEFPIEEFNWVCGAERADSLGADVISSSLGYGYDWSNPVADYLYSDLNGDITMAARGADIAAAKGILVFNAAGNSGNDSWKMITTPADGDSVVAVGAVNNNRQPGSFSSYGPSADGRIKPDLASVGVAAMLQTTSGTIGLSNGTSFACPNLAGLASCLWQGFPEYNNMRIIQAMKESADRYSQPDTRTGYGIPDMKKAFMLLLADFAEAEASQSACTATLRWKTKEAAGMKYIIERRYAHESSFVPVAGNLIAAENRTLHTVERQYTVSLSDASSQPVQFRILQVVDTSADNYAVVVLDSISLAAAVCPAFEKFTIRVPEQPVQSSSGLIGLAIESPEAKNNLNLGIISSAGQIVHSSKLAAVAKGQSYTGIPARIGIPGIYWLVIYEGKKLLARTAFLHL